MQHLPSSTNGLEKGLPLSLTSTDQYISMQWGLVHTGPFISLLPCFLSLAI